MLRYFQTRFALSEAGARSLAGGIFFTILLNIALMLPAVFVFMFLADYLEPLIQPEAGVGHGFLYYVIMASLFLLCTFVIAMFQYTGTYTNVYTESANRRIALAERMRKLPLAFFGEKNLSDLTATVMEDNNMMEMLFSHCVPQLFASIAGILLMAVGLFFYEWHLALALFWVVPVAAVVFFLSKRAMDNSHRKLYVVKRRVTERIQEALENIQEIKSYNGEESYLTDFDADLDVYEKELTKGELLAGTFLNFSYILLKLGLGTVVIVGAWLLSSGSVGILTYLIFLMVASSIYNPISDVFNHMAILAFLDVRIQRMREMEAMPVQHGKTECEITDYDIVFDNVSFAYEAGKQVLSGVSFTARQGEVTALVGPSGGGKSTSAKLAARFWDIDGGRITLGGEDISQIDPETLLENYAIVFQDVLLFNASVADNIRVGKKDATDEEVRRVARLAQCEEFIDRMPEGYDTLIGENGAALSGGERQRISIARALLKDAPIVLLDEATASLDVENETKIQAAISELIREKTVLIIAHRMRTVAKAHKVVVLKEGRVVEQGTPFELMNLNGEFARMVERQTGN